MLDLIKIAWLFPSNVLNTDNILPIWLYGAGIIQVIICLFSMMFWDNQRYWKHIFGQKYTRSYSRSSEKRDYDNEDKVSEAGLSCFFAFLWPLPVGVAYYLSIVFCIPLFFFGLFKCRNALKKKLDTAFMDKKF